MEDIYYTIDKICNKELQNRKINKKPKCIIIGGLPGAGKTNLAKLIQNKYSHRDFIVIDTDAYRKLHPDYENLKKVPEKAVEETSTFSNTLEAELIKRAIQAHCDIISISTLRATEGVNKILYEPAVLAGYEVEVEIMSVPITESGISAQKRYEIQILKGECPRFTPMNFIESSFDGIKNTIKIFQEKKDGPPINVYSRGKGENSLPIEIYTSQKPNGKYQSALDAFENPVRHLDHKEAIEQIEELYKIKKYRYANYIEYISLKRLEELLQVKVNM